MSTEPSPAASRAEPPATANPDLDALFENNRRWSAGQIAADPEYFQRLASQQRPRYFWVGCSDSRVPANQILGLAPGEVFVHRNVSNLVVHSDLNCLTVVQFAVDVFQVEHVMIVGHYGCGGVHASMQQQRLGLADNWLRHVADVRQAHAAWFDEIPDPVVQFNRLCELNVVEQVANLARTTVLLDAWQRGQKLQVHGLIYGLHDGMLRRLCQPIDSAEVIDPAYRSAIQRIRDTRTRFAALPGPAASRSGTDVPAAADENVDTLGQTRLGR